MKYSRSPHLDLFRSRLLRALPLLLFCFCLPACKGSGDNDLPIAVQNCQCGCGGSPRPYCAHKDCACANTGVATVEAAMELTVGCGCGCGGTPRPYCAHRACQCANLALDGSQVEPFVDPLQD